MPKPPAPGEPQVTVAGPSTLRISWEIPDVEPEVTACTVKLRIFGSQRLQNYDHATGRLVIKGGMTVPAPTCEVTADGIEEGLAYEAFVAAMNSEGWGDVSSPSKPTTIGEPKPRAKPFAPAPPKLVGLAPGKLKCSWTLPQCCPPVEASQLQITDIVQGTKMLVDASNGKLVHSGRTTFAAPRCDATINGIADSNEYVATVCYRNAEGFGDYSSPSQPASSSSTAQVSTNGMQLVLHQGPVAEAPILEAIGDGKMNVRWTLPTEAKSTTVKMRRVGDNNWYLCGGTAIAAPASETVAFGMEEGIEYEAIVSFLINGRWCPDSHISAPVCVGEKKLPGIPGASQEPKLTVIDHSKIRVKWQLLTTVPPVTGITIKFRALGAKTWQYVQPGTCQLIAEEPEPLAAPATEIEVVNLVQGIRYEAAVAFRNKLGRGPDSGPSDPVCIGRPTPNLVKCTYCLGEYDLQHAEYTKSPESFWCLACRFRHMDPFNALVEPNGMLVCSIVVRPTISFQLDLPELKSWRKDDHSVFMRMVKVDSGNCAQVWPFTLTLEANGNEVFAIKEPEEGHVRRDIPRNISAGLRPGMNNIVIRITDEYVAGYALALVRTHARTAKQISAEIPMCGEEAARHRVNSMLADTWSVGDNEEEEITCVISNKLKLRCPLSFERVVIPVRGENCMHLQCFGLGAYLESNMKMRALNNRWTCPVCGNILKPGDLRIDGFVERVLAETPSHIEDVLILQGGSYRVIEELPQNGTKVSEPQTGTLEEALISTTVTCVAAPMVDDEVGVPITLAEKSTAGDPPAKRQRRRQKLVSIANESGDDSD